MTECDTSSDPRTTAGGRQVNAAIGGDRTHEGLATTLTYVMAISTGLAVANIYYNQPLIGLMTQAFSGDRLIALIPTATIVGYAIGILLLVPLSDRVDRRQLILLQSVGLTAALVFAAIAPGPVLLLAASAMVGVFGSVAQQIIPFAAELSDPARRGRTVGAMMSGLLVGILLARTGSGFVGAWFGWRAVFWVGALLSAAMGFALAWRLPHSTPTSREPYGRMLASLVVLLARERELRTAAVTQGLLFAAFSAFWAILALLLATPRFGLGSEAAGLFGVLAVGGVFIAPYAGRRADRSGPGGIVVAGTLTVLAAFVLMLFRTSLVTLGIGVVVMDAGIQMAMISNQSIIFARAGDARGRFNTVFIATMFAFGAAGSALASAAWVAGGWRYVMLLSAGFALAAFAFRSWAGRSAPTDGEPSS